MKRERHLGVSAVLVFLSLALVLLMCQDGAWAKNPKMFVEDELLIQFSIDTPEHKAKATLNAHGAAVADEIQQLRIKRIKVPAHVREMVREALSHNPHVEFVENNFLAEASGTPNDTYYPSQWHLPKIDAPSGWDITAGSTNVSVAIIDSGVDPDHPDLVAKLITGYNFLGSNTDTHDVLGHGTAVAGTAAAMTNNLTGVAGLACDNPVMPLVVLNSSNYASYYDISRAITYAVDRNIRVLNISIGGSSSSSTLQNAADYAWNKGALIFASAMNNNNSIPYYPAACNHVVAVAATTSSDTKASFSSYGTWVDISAPGASIYTTKNGGGYGYWNGTSFASPLTAGLAALIWSVNPSLTNAQVYDILTENADDLGTLGFDQYFGYGRINALKSLLAAIENEPEIDATAPVVSITTPSSNITISGFVSVSVSASDNVGVSKVELYVNNALFTTDTGSPYSFVWDTTKVADGTCSLKALAYDSAGNIGQSASVAVNVSNADTIAPVVSISSPSNNAVISGTISVSASASDNIGVSKVEFYINNTLFASDISSPYSFSWDTTKFAGGSYSLNALAFDSAGNVGQSASISVTVSNDDTTAPEVSITSLASGAAVSGVITVSASASDNVGVSKVELYINGSLFASDSSKPYAFTWDTTRYANDTYTLFARAYDNAGNVGQSTSMTVTVMNSQQDTAAPQVTITYPSDGSSIPSHPVLKIAVSASDNVGVSAIELYIDGSLMAATNASSLSYNWNTKKVAAGAHTITAKAYDAAGNIGSHTITIYK